MVADVVKLTTQPGTEEPAQYPSYALAMLALFDRCRGLFGAARLLAQHEFGQEALILTRPMFTEALMLLEVASADEKRRVELVVGYELATLADLEGLFRESEARGGDESDELAFVAARRASLERYAKRHNARTRQWRIDEKKLADKHVAGDGYLDFRMSHHFVHGTTLASQQRYAPHGDVVIVGGPGAASQDWTQGALISASHSMVLAVRGICRILGWPEPPEVPELLARIDQIARGADAEQA